ncbi:MAG: hypothetical protein KF850_19170 [Labilithrix sp.]|nr:hypothetical protein [Labilithrix sp.]
MTAPRRIVDDLSVHEGVKSSLSALRGDLPIYDVAHGAARFEATLAASARAASPVAARITSTLAMKGLFAVGALLLLGSATYALSSGSGRDASSPGGRSAATEGIPRGSAPEGSGERSEPPPSTGVSVDSLPSAPVSATASPASATAAVPAIPALASAPSSKERSTSVSEEREREVRHLASLQQIAANDPERAIQLAKEGHAQFARGALFQERELILIDALVRAGRDREARDHSWTFLEAYPKSPSAAHVREILER